MSKILEYIFAIDLVMEEHKITNPILISEKIQEDLDMEVSAFEELWGCPPTLIVVDNLMDIANDGGEEFAGMRSTIKELKYLARDTNAALLVLHHTKEGYEGSPCQPRSSVQGLVNQIPAMVLTIGQQMQGQDVYLCVAPVKNRYGKADHTGATYISLSFDPASMYLEDIVRDYRQIETSNG